MIKYLLTAAALFVAVPAQAGLVLLPYTFAEEYCTMRSYGVNHDEALEVAVRESAIEGDPIKVTIDGREYDADVVKANRTALEQCPQYF